MARIKTEQLKVGMVVTGDVKNIDNMLLIPSGCALSERQIDILQAWGVNEIDVQAAQGAQDVDPLVVLDPEIVARLSAEIKALFWNPDETNPVFTELFQLMLRRRAHKYLGH